MPNELKRLQDAYFFSSGCVFAELNGTQVFLMSFSMSTDSNLFFVLYIFIHLISFICLIFGDLPRMNGPIMVNHIHSLLARGAADDEPSQSGFPSHLGQAFELRQSKAWKLTTPVRKRWEDDGKMYIFGCLYDFKYLK